MRSLFWGWVQLAFFALPNTNSDGQAWLLLRHVTLRVAWCVDATTSAHVDSDATPTKLTAA